MMTYSWGDLRHYYFLFLIFQVVGLCGNYNGDEGDDFTPSYGGMPVTSPIEFGDSWKVIGPQ